MNHISKQLQTQKKNHTAWRQTWRQSGCVCGSVGVNKAWYSGWGCFLSPACHGCLGSGLVFVGGSGVDGNSLGVGGGSVFSCTPSISPFPHNSSDSSGTAIISVRGIISHRFWSPRGIFFFNLAATQDKSSANIPSAPSAEDSCL